VATYQFRLYLSGNTPRPECTADNLRHLLDEKVPDDYELSVIDLQAQPHAWEADRVLATPTLIRAAPEPVLRWIGDLSNAAALARLLDLD
jgi:circadian clock protein KaiB